MGTRKVITIAELQGIDLLRRKTALIAIAALPLVIYLALALGSHNGYQHVNHSNPYAIGTGTLGLSWAVGGAALFANLAARPVDPRLILSGYQSMQILLGRVILLEALGGALAVAFTLFMSVISKPQYPAALLLATILCAIVSVSLGTFLAAVLPKELEGTLSLIGVTGIQLTLPHSSEIQLALPFYGPIRIVDFAAGYNITLMEPVLHSLAYAFVLIGITAVVRERQIKARKVTISSIVAKARQKSGDA